MDTRNKPDSDAEVFREAMAGVRPLRPANVSEPAATPPGPHPRQSELDESRVVRELLDPKASDADDFETGEELLFLRPGHAPRLLRQLRRGVFSVSDSIDLHQLREPVARQVLVHFLAESVSRGRGCVRVVHGKGLRSRGEPKLKRMTSHVLRRHPAVIAFASCRPVDGGTGAVLVLLRNRPPGRP